MASICCRGRTFTDVMSARMAVAGRWAQTVAATSAKTAAGTQSSARAASLQAGASTASVRGTSTPRMSRPAALPRRQSMAPMRPRQPTTSTARPRREAAAFAGTGPVPSPSALGVVELSGLTAVAPRPSRRWGRTCAPPADRPAGRPYACRGAGPAGPGTWRCGGRCGPRSARPRPRPGRRGPYRGRSGRRHARPHARPDGPARWPGR